MAAVLVATNLLLIPYLGLLGAALAGAAVTAASNLWYLGEVRRTLGIRPPLSKYRALLIPTTLMILCVLLIHRFAISTWHAWWTILVALAVGYLVFVATSLLFLDGDDRVVAEAIWTKLLGLAPGAKRQIP
jgi:O-antigen/teichoic acid export membrane protein